MNFSGTNIPFRITVDSDLSGAEVTLVVKPPKGRVVKLTGDQIEVNGNQVIWEPEDKYINGTYQLQVKYVIDGITYNSDIIREKFYREVEN